MSRCIKDITGKKFGKLLILEKIIKNLKSTRWRCQCECGKIIEKKYSEVLRRKSCGCSKTGNSRHPLYNTWYLIKYRCSDKDKKNAKHYFLQGITIATKWENSFVAFKEWIESNLGPRPKGMTLDRINSYKNYAPGNLRWATPNQQAYNSRKQYNRKTISKFKGVYWEGKKKLWRAILIHKGKRIGLGRYKNETEAAHAWNKAALKYRGPGYFQNKI